MTPSADSAAASRDLAYVRELTEATRTATMLSGSYFLLWGGLASLGLLLTWLVLEGWIAAAGPAAFGWIWGVLGAVGAAGTAWLVARENRQAAAIGRAATQIGLSWLGSGVAVGLLFFVGALSGAVPWTALSGLISILLGLGLWQHGLLAGIAWLRHLSWVWWLGAALMLLLPGPHTCLVLAGMTLVGYTLPGWWLARGRWKLHGAA
jgi:hypothetical protein